MTRHHLSKGFGHELIVMVVLQGAGMNAHFTNFVIVELQTNVQFLLLGETAPTCLKSIINFLKGFVNQPSDNFLLGTFVDRS